jgi:hypothetical protein
VVYHVLLFFFNATLPIFFSVENENESNENPMEYNEKKRKLLGSGIHDSFLHPKPFKIEKLTLPKKMEAKKQTKQLEALKGSKITKHRFNII